MKKKLLVTLSLLAATGAMALAGCKGSGSNSATDTGSTDTQSTDTTPVDTVTVARVKTTALKGPAILGQDLDLSNNVEVTYSDGTKSNTAFSIAAGDGYTVNGTIINFYTGGSYDLRITAERGGSSKTVAFHVDVVTEERLAFETLWNAIDRNFTAVFSDDAALTKVSGVALHKDDDYVYNYMNGSRYNGVVAKLADGQHYSGAISKNASGFAFDFSNAEICNWAQEFGSVSVQEYFTADKFVSTFNDNDEETIAFEGESESLSYLFAVVLNGSYFYGETSEKIEFVSADLEAKELQCKIVFDGDESDPMYITFQDIGCSEDAALEAIIADPSKVPAKIDGSAVDAAIAAANTAKNYTITANSVMLNSAGQPMDNPYADGTLGSLFTVSSTTKKVLSNETQTVDNVTGDEYGLVEEGGKLYRYTKEADGTYSAAEVDGETSVWNYDIGSNTMKGVVDALASNPFVYTGEEDFDGTKGYKINVSQAWTVLDMLVWSTGNNDLMNLAYNIDYFAQQGSDYSNLFGTTMYAIPEANQTTFTAQVGVTGGYWIWEIVVKEVGTTVRTPISYTFGA